MGVFVYQTVYGYTVANSITISSPIIKADNSTQYNITAVFSAPGGIEYTDPNGWLTIVPNYQGTNSNPILSGKIRGNIIWSHADIRGYSYSYIDVRNCAGYGTAGVLNYSYWGVQYIHLDSCSVTYSGGITTLVFTVRFTPSFTFPTTDNDITVQISEDVGYQYDYWKNFDTNFSLYQTPYSYQYQYQYQYQTPYTYQYQYQTPYAYQYEYQTPTFSVTSVKRTGGIVKSTDNAINCGSTCAQNYATGNIVTLIAYPNSSYWKFTGWSGDCSGTGPCILNVTGAKTVTPSFSLRLFNYLEF